MCNEKTGIHIERGRHFKIVNVSLLRLSWFSSTLNFEAGHCQDWQCPLEVNSTAHANTSFLSHYSGPFHLVQSLCFFASSFSPPYCGLWLSPWEWFEFSPNSLPPSQNTYPHLPSPYIHIQLLLLLLLLQQMAVGYSKGYGTELPE